MRQLLAVTSLLFLTSFATPQSKPTLEDFLSPAYPYELVAARRAERIAWLANERGMRNVYTASGPTFEPVRLTAFLADDGVDLTSLRISDDGNVVVFVRGHTPNRDGWIANPSSDPRGAERAIWAADTEDGNPWKLAIGSDPEVSPDGNRVAFARDGQIYCARTDEPGTEQDVSRPWFRVFGSNSGPRWSPTGEHLAFVSDRGNHSFIGIYDVAANRVSYLAPSVDRDTSPSWTSDGRSVVFIRRPGLPFGRQELGFFGRRRSRSRTQGSRQSSTVPGMMRAAFRGGYTFSLWIADVASGKGREFWHPGERDRGFGRVRSVTCAGDHVVFRYEKGNWDHRWSIPITGETATTSPTDLTPGEGIAEQASISPDGRYVYYASNAGDIDRRHLHRTPVAGGPTEAVTEGTDIETYPVVLASRTTVATLQAGARQPLSVAVVAASGGKPRIVFPRLDERFPRAAHVTPEAVVLEAEDGVKFHNQLFVPPDIRPGERRPAILFTHGGPRRQMLLGYHYRHFYHTAYAVNQYFASRGYVVISVNYRSGIGYGRSFRNARNTRTRGNAEYRDVLAAGKYLQQRKDVDPSRIGLWGLSYGGLLTAQGLARNSDVFAAGVDMAGVHQYGSSLDPNDLAYKSSAISAIAKWKSPVLLIQADDDRNVPFAQTVGLVQLLRAHNVHHEVIVFPDDVHAFLIHARWLRALHAADDFFARFLGPKAAEASHRK